MLAILARVLYFEQMKKNKELLELSSGDLNTAVKVFSELAFWFFHQQEDANDNDEMLNFFRKTASTVLLFYRKQQELFHRQIDAEITAKLGDVCWMIVTEDLNPEETKERISSALHPAWLPSDSQERDKLLDRMVLTKKQIQDPEINGAVKAGVFMASILYGSYATEYQWSESTLYNERYRKRKRLKENFCNRVSPFVQFRRPEFEAWILRITTPLYAQSQNQDPESQD
jgi:hypothetical protein